MMIKGLEVGAIKLLINLNKKNAYEAARNVAEAIDKTLDERYGAQKSESVQASMCAVIKLFCDTLLNELQKDWPPEMKARHTDVLPDLPVKSLGEPQPKEAKKSGKTKKPGRKRG